ncbi:GNAT family N-acetyltransferase [Metabacillus mangrovi]|uniref:GNAT family N-acetyltransferase n=1 Tax=Metabacillus mangrovi TaxID=1491830 RepID=UPI001391A627|nr:GNAT family N-acetyltransferase [Metabacillus mangrovi]
MRLIIKKGIPSHLVSDAAKIFTEAFERKFVRIIGNKQRAHQLFLKGFNPQNALCAITEEGELVGVAGYHMNGKSLADLTLKDFIDEFGPFKGRLKAFAAHVLFSRKPSHPEELLMDSISVSASSRGMGAGTKLFAALIELAEEGNYTSIKLDVIDENPQAKKLYSRLGFKVVKHQKVPGFINRLIGVSGVSTMVKSIKP